MQSEQPDSAVSAAEEQLRQRIRATTILRRTHRRLSYARRNAKEGERRRRIGSGTRRRLRHGSGVGAGAVDGEEELQGVRAPHAHDAVACCARYGISVAASRAYSSG